MDLLYAKETEGVVGVEKQIQASGFVILPRLEFKSLRDQLIYQLLVVKASYNGNGNLNIGETVIVLSDLEKETGWSRKAIKNSLDRLKGMGLISFETLPQKRGILVTVLDYSQYQRLENYTKNKGKQAQEKAQEKEHEKEQGNNSENPCGSRGESMSEHFMEQEKEQEKAHRKAQLNNITAYINSINNINKTLKEYIAEANVKSKNLSSTVDIEIFVDFALRTNALPTGTSKKILVAYFDCIRLTRQTCTISANILVKFIEKIQKYSINQIHFALWKHVEQHDDKRESYTLGILRNTNEHEARRGLIKLKNKGGIASENHQSGDTKYEYGF
jgi:DNA-binding MarR family transcriptional regulator